MLLLKTIVILLYHVLMQFMWFSGLHKRKTPNRKGFAGVWNGNEFVYTKSNWYLVALYRLFKRYGLNPLTNRFEIKSMLSEFGKIYDLQRWDCLANSFFFI